MVGNIKKVLLVLTIAHKYCAVSIEARALELATALTEPPHWYPLPASTIPMILEVAQLVNSTKLAASSKSYLLDELRSSPANGLQALKFG